MCLALPRMRVIMKKLINFKLVLSTYSIRRDAGCSGSTDVRVVVYITLSSLWTLKCRLHGHASFTQCEDVVVDLS